MRISHFVMFSGVPSDARDALCVEHFIDAAEIAHAPYEHAIWAGRLGLSVDLRQVADSSDLTAVKAVGGFPLVNIDDEDTRIVPRAALIDRNQRWRAFTVFAGAQIPR